jgi:preprotein translocase subunit YajC
VNVIEIGFVPLQAAAEPSPLSMLVPMGLIFLIFYFLLIRPQQRRQREQEQLLKAIEKNDNVITAGGLHGKVVGIADDVLTLEIAALKGERVRVKVSRAKIDSVSKAKKGEVEEA